MSGGGVSCRVLGMVVWMGEDMGRIGCEEVRQVRTGRGWGRCWGMRLSVANSRNHIF